MTTTDTERLVRAMSKPERVAYLRERGWYRLSYSGSQAWFAPGWQRDAYGWPDPPEHDRAFYSLASAIRKAVGQAALTNPQEETPSPPTPSDSATSA